MEELLERIPLGLREIVSQVMEVEGVEADRKFITFHGSLFLPPEKALLKTRAALEELEYIPLLRRERGEVVLKVGRIKRETGKPRPIVNLILLVLTVLTTLWVGAGMRGVNVLEEPSKLWLGAPFSVSLLLILGAHELGHFFTCKRLGVKASLPYFIPFPFHLFGTFGAVIKIRSPIPDRKALIEVGAAGPLVGLAFAIPLTVVGLKLSQVISTSSLGEGALYFGNSILYLALSRLVLGSLAEGYDVLLHPLAYAGWIGFFVTSINLLPLGQLDGGHISYSLFGGAHRKVAWVAFAALAGLGLFWPIWFFWAFLALLLGMRHPPPLDDVTLLDKKHLVLGAVCFVFLLLTFTPIPVRLAGSQVSGLFGG